MLRNHSPEFSTRSDAERYIADRDLAGRKKPQHVGGKWYLVRNREGRVNRSLFSEVMRVELRRMARRERWTDSRLRYKLSQVPAESERVWQSLSRIKHNAQN